MAFPATPLDVEVDIFVDDTWTDITEYVFDRDSIQISRGRRDWSSRIDPSSAHLTLNNADGRFSPRNPVSPYYGLIGRNTPIRVSVTEGAPFLALPGVAGSAATAPDTPGISVTGDIDIRLDVAPNSAPDVSDTANFQALVNKYDADTNSRSWALWINPDGTIGLRYGSDGTFATVKDVASTIPVPWGPGRRAVRVTLDVDNGSSGHTVTFYTAPDINGTRTQLGDPVVGTGTTSLDDGTAPIQIGENPDISGMKPFDGRVYAFELRSGIGGTVVANPDFTAQTVGDTSFSDAVGNTWTLTGDSEITNRNYRFTGEVSSWPQKWDLSGNDVYVPIEAAGILRRLNQGQPPQNSALFREFTNPARQSIVAYWPCEDGQNTRLIGSAFPDHAPGTVAGSPEFASDSSYVASLPLPKMNDARFNFNVPNYTVTGETSMRIYMSMPAGGTGSDTRMFALKCTGSAALWELHNASDGIHKTLVAKSVDGNTLLTTTNTFDFDGKKVVYDLELTENAGNIDYRVVVFDLTLGTREFTPTFAFSGTLSSQTVGKVTNISAVPDGGMADTVLGHVVLANAIDAYDDTLGAMLAWQGEQAGDRIYRLCKEENIPYVRQGVADTVVMGPQTAEIVTDLLQECVDADGGILFEPRDRVGLGYIDRVALYNQNPALSLDYGEGDLVGSLDPVDDDQSTINDVTVSRTGGGSSRAVLEIGPLSVQDPPDGIGRYPDQTSQNLGFDFQLADAAGWRLKQGTVDESRYPNLSIDLSHDVFANDADLTEKALLLEQGQRLLVSDLPAWLPPDDISQIVQGYTETLTQFGWMITFNCTPERPYRVAVAGDGVLGRANTSGSTMNADATSTATSLSVKTSVGPVWTTDSVDFPFDVEIAGERITVTSISGTTSPQTFTVTRSVNGVVKALSENDGVRLYQPSILPL